MSASIDVAFSAAYYCYYLIGEVGLGIWHGGAVEALGFLVHLTAESLQAAFDGFSANGLKELVQLQAWKDRQRQPAWDICFSPPKYLSCLWAVASPYWRHRIEQIVLAAAKRAVDYLEEHAVFTRRGKYGARVEKAKALVALILHGTSRALDAQLHIHTLWINACLRQDGTTGAIRSRDLYEHKMAAGAVFHLELAHLLQKELGLVTVRDEENPWTFKLPGVSEEFCRDQSKRREVIEALAKEKGCETAREYAELAVTTRQAKRHVNLRDCFHAWQETGKAFGFSTKEADQLLSLGQARLLANSKASVRHEQRKAQLVKAVDKAANRIATHDAYFPQRKVLQEVNTLLQGQQYSASEVINAVAQQLANHYPQVEVPAKAEQAFYSTKENIAAERELLERVTKGKESTSHLVTSAAVEKAVQKEEQLLSKALGTKAQLTEDQKRSLRHILVEPGNLKLIQGNAGTGKTQLLRAANRASVECGYRMIGCSLTGRAAKVLEQTTGIPSVTVAALLHTLRPELTPKELRQTFGEKLKSAIRAEMYEARRAGRWIKTPLKESVRELGQAVKAAIAGKEVRPQLTVAANTIVVVDEVPTLPTKAFLALKRECDKAGAKLIGVGDRHQLPPVEAGSPFWSIANITGCESLTTNVRQRHAWMKTAVDHILADRPLSALQLYAERGSLTIAEHPTAAIQKLVERYSQIAPHELSEVAALTQTNKEAMLINKAVQKKRQAAKQLGLTHTKLANGQKVYVGDIVVVRENNYQNGLRNGMRGTVIGIRRARGIAGPGVLNIHLHGEKQGGLFRWRPKTTAIDLKKYPFIELGYAITTNLSQGSTFKETLALASDTLNSKNMAYTQLTRHKDKCMLYATEASQGDSLQYLAKQISKSVAKDLALDYRVKVEKARRRDKVQDQQLEYSNDIML